MRRGTMTITGPTDVEKIRCCIEDPYSGESYKAFVSYSAFTKAKLHVDQRKVYNILLSGEYHDVISILGVNEEETQKRRQYLSTLL